MACNQCCNAARNALEPRVDLKAQVVNVRLKEEEAGQGQQE